MEYLDNARRVPRRQKGQPLRLTWRSNLTEGSQPRATQRVPVFGHARTRIHNASTLRKPLTLALLEILARKRSDLRPIRIASRWARPGNKKGFLGYLPGLWIKGKCKIQRTSKRLKWYLYQMMSAEVKTAKNSKVWPSFKVYLHASAGARAVRCLRREKIIEKNYRPLNLSDLDAASMERKWSGFSCSRLQSSARLPPPTVERKTSAAPQT